MAGAEDSECSPPESPDSPEVPNGTPRGTPEADRARATAVPSLDWPLSRDEKRTRVLRLYDAEVHAADEMIQSGQLAMEKLQGELDTIKCASQPGAMTPDECPATADPDKEAERLRLRQSIESATALLKGLLEQAGIEAPAADAVDGADDDCHVAPRPRARSEGAERTEPLRSALRPARRRRWSRGGKQLRVSFSERPKYLDGEDEPVEPESEPPDPTDRPQQAPWRRPIPSWEPSEVMSLKSFLGQDVPSFPFSAQDAARGRSATRGL
eukprot:gnl/TRDRNA2_/TRDRNA2_55813_c1_seq1.p1 gnl/TRDRNA2_/TRDRNA2_55813_c1~~gnl/TRDRNA2_/TRDRNA2_55813_c1_seq1.p1  ORF type:complete len:285 (-),score=55.82 gnl/TRDRNA2_/TRDRNA2_55813_c1_seq1:62-868(-)